MNDLPLDDLPRGNGDADVYGYPGQQAVEHSVEPENALWADLLSDVDLPNELIKEDTY